jgi:hypothetical protein
VERWGEADLEYLVSATESSELCSQFVIIIMSQKKGRERILEEEEAI